ncbi:MAG: ASCH domain-containing protein [Bdellovibrionaceae bacterium]|nr:ASCH domain-containing protein [Pseudobdellovibrionaceae bacterium]
MPYEEQGKRGDRCVPHPEARSAPAYFIRLFQPQFAGLVEKGTKCQTVRPTPKRMPKHGDRISLRAWAGKPYRSKQRVLRGAVVFAVKKVRIEAGAVWPNLWLDGQRQNAQATSQFAMRDGFLDAQRMGEWFQEHHQLPV